MWSKIWSGTSEWTGKQHTGRSIQDLQQNSPQLPDLLLCVMLKYSGLLFGNHQSSRLRHLQDTVKSPELLHLQQDISCSGKIAPDTGLLSGNRSSPGFRVWLLPERNLG
ncbi:hypothetical protein F2Q70_00012058 [Brassica cretica]|uniref:Uncharacterized protein n=2 Tax=Brassica cretica TaxID=69181 RepID=A0A3N6QWD6_BRACR|nr:hypothetical protein F2Q68_00005163 [Brassica cretica]KAF2615118.1 hypothetical protein F2Q70_00012058 [Brassica cretica]KAF3545869.1 hypothetical protein DY000_02007823 [Brassica cretica]